jgi:hypothetical protein
MIVKKGAVAFRCLDVHKIEESQLRQQAQHARIHPECLDVRPRLQ